MRFAYVLMFIAISGVSHATVDYLNGLETIERVSEYCDARGVMSEDLNECIVETLRDLETDQIETETLIAETLGEQ